MFWISKYYVATIIASISITKAMDDFILGQEAAIVCKVKFSFITNGGFLNLICSLIIFKEYLDVE